MKVQIQLFKKRGSLAIAQISCFNFGQFVSQGVESLILTASLRSNVVLWRFRSERVSIEIVQIGGRITEPPLVPIVEEVLGVVLVPIALTVNGTESVKDIFI